MKSITHVASVNVIIIAQRTITSAQRLIMMLMQTCAMNVRKN